MKANQKYCTFELLEARQLMSAATYMPTDNFQVALHDAKHVGTTTLYLNFDGGTIDDVQTDNKSITVAPFQPVIGKYDAYGVADRNAAIQDIIYKVAESFSPFNVRVEIMRGAGNFANTNGATTIFIGANANNVSGGFKTEAGSTPWNSSDHAGTVHGTGHGANSDTYDLAFIDPSYYSPSDGKNITMNDSWTANAVAHEAGHTFGLAHVLTQNDTNYPSTINSDVMSYDNEGAAFNDKSFSLTDENYDVSTGLSPSNPKERITVNAVDALGFATTDQLLTQNSFAYLRYALGNHDVANDSYNHFVADAGSVSTDYYNVLGASASLTRSSTTSSLLGGFGDYDAYSFKNSSSSKLGNIVAVGQTKISLTVGNATGGSAFDPQILLYDSNGTELLAAAHGSSLQYAMTNNGSYKIVISGYLGDSAGAYTMSFSTVAPPAKLAPISATTFAATTTAAPTSTAATSTTTASITIAKSLFSTTAINA